MKLKYNFVVNNVAGQKVAVAVDVSNSDYNSLIKLNDTGVYILEMLKNDVTIDEIVASIKKDFEILPEQDIEKIVNDFINKLKESDVLE